MASEFWRKLTDYSYLIPETYKKGMRVPAIVFADEGLIAQADRDRALEQVINVAFLPGIVRASYAMPDIHWGYGFCLTNDTNILTDFGFYKPIKDFEKDWFSQSLKTLDLSSQKIVKTAILKFLKLKPKEVFRVVTKTGYEIKATGDHPLFTPLGMKPLREISLKEKAAIFPFQGVPYEKPSNEIVISEKNIRRTLLKLGRKPNTPKFEIILQKLRKRNLLPLTYDHPKLPYILKIMGFIFGDGSMNFIGKRGDGILHFGGKLQDLEEARKDLKKIGYTPSPIHLQKTKSLSKKKHYKNYSFNVNASSLVIILETLGVPRGSKVNQAYRVPKWIFKAPLWQKRLFLASLFGCELRRPHRRLNRRGYFNAPVFPMAKREELIKNGKDFLKDIARFLKEFGVKTLYIDKRKKHTNTKGEISWALELIISSKPENLLNLWGKIGFEYNSERLFKANVAVQYLKFRQKILEEKEEAIKITIPKLLEKGLSYQKIALQLGGNPVTKRFIIDVCYKLNKSKKVTPRIPASFPEFDNFLKDFTKGLGYSGLVWDEIVKIEKIDYQDFVYDFTVYHSDHNFMADNFVVSNCIGGVAAFDTNSGVISPGGVGYDINCGVRLVKTNLMAQEVKPMVRPLLYEMARNIPKGVGSHGQIKLSRQEMEEVLTKGVKWAVGRGYGWKEDLEFIEEGGALVGADPSRVSERAFQRGKDQLGTLGAGNHFLEIQEVVEVYNEKVAQTFGLYKGQLVVMIHSGSRGLGHQICSDYIKVMEQVVRREGIELPDRQLCCAPIGSKEQRDYYAAMAAAVNYAFTNRHIMAHFTRVSFENVFKKSAESLGMNLLYDVAHNIAKFEEHEVDGKKMNLCIHRKGATRAFGPGHSAVPLAYREIGQPVIIPGDMGRASFVLVGTDKAMTESWGSSCHGSGRVMSRTQAKKRIRGDQLKRELEEKGIVVVAGHLSLLAEEAPQAYKDVSKVVEICDGAGISKKVAKMKPMGVLKG